MIHSTIYEFLRRVLSEDVDPDRFSGHDSLDTEVDKLLKNYFEECETKHFTEAVHFEKKPDGKLKTLEDVNVSDLAGSIARFVQNPDSVLDIKGLIMRRAVNYARQMYDDTVIDALQADLRKSQGIDSEDPNGDEKEFQFKAPRGEYAGPITS